MQLRSGCKFVASQEIINEIAATHHRLCDIDFIRSASDDSKIVTVGDVTTENVVNAGVPVHLQIVDLKTKRDIVGRFTHVAGSHLISNEPGTLSHDLFLLIDKMMNGEGGRIEIEGEEDLSVIPIIYYSEVNTVVAYGVPDVGMACLKVENDLKTLVAKLIERMRIECPS